MFRYWIDKFKKEKTRLFAKISDKIFKTTKFDAYQRKYANYYQNNYSLTVGQYSFVHIPKTAGSFLHTWLPQIKILENPKDAGDWGHHKCPFLKWGVQNVFSGVQTVFNHVLWLVWT